MSFENDDIYIKKIRELGKYKEMWEEFKYKRGDTCIDRTQLHLGTIRDDMNEFEQKHFLRLKKTITFTIEAKTNSELGTAINDFMNPFTQQVLDPAVQDIFIIDRT